MTTARFPRRQRGAVVVTVCLMLLFLLGFMAFALDLSRLFIVKSELQTAMDSCALAAAQELDGLGGAVTRAQSAGATAANANRVNLQSATWDGQGQVTSANITFRDKNYVATTVDNAAVYVECGHTQPNVRLWLLAAMGAFNGNTGIFTSTHDVFARAVAKRGSSQTSCPIPVALKAASGGNASNLYGYSKGQWAIIFNKTHNSGEFGWYNLDGSNSANETKNELTSSSCNTKVGDSLGTPGAQTAVDTPWNQRFGIYKNGDGPSANRPDYTGYSYTPFNWPRDATQCAGISGTLPCKAYSGTKPTGAGSTAGSYVTKRAGYASFDDTGTSVSDGSQITFGSKNQMNSFKSLATPGATGQHQQYGASRRIATVPVLDASNKVVDYVCVLMLAPMSGPNDDNYIEVLGMASDAASPCTTSGLPGGVAGPLVPVLVR